MSGNKKLVGSVALLLLLLNCNVWSQKADILNSIKTQNYQVNWSVYLENDDILIEWKYSDCSDPKNGYFPEYILFKITNKTSKKLSVEWDWFYEYAGIVQSSEILDEDHVKMTLEAQEAKEGQCTHSNLNHLRMYVRNQKAKNPTPLTDFNFNNLTINEQ